jgi:hypothetical protein
MRQVQNSVTQQNHQLLVLSFKCSCQWAVVCLCHSAVSDPLPKLSLSGPKLLSIAANYQCSFLLRLLFLVFITAHQFPLRRLDTLLPRSVLHFTQVSYEMLEHTVPRRETSHARRRQIVKPFLDFDFQAVSLIIQAGP